MMTSVFDVSKHMGDYLLKGWTLTNDPCPTCSVPRMKSPPYLGPSRLICVNCDPETTTAEPPKVSEDISPRNSIFTNSISRQSTPPTEVSPPGSPAFTLPPPSQETLARRAQSDRASQEIGTRLLQGWAMLADECPNPTCYGIPLVRAPGGDRAKECVVCGNRYITESDATAARLSTVKPPTPAPVKESESHSISTKQGNYGLHPGTIDPPDSSSNLFASNISFKKPLSNSESSLLESLPGHLQQSLATLDRLLIDATGSSNVQRIGDIAEAISKVSKALKDVSNSI